MTEIAQPITVDESEDSYDSASNFSETTSVATSLLKGHIENGRRYLTLRDDYWGPSDDQQFETMDLGHLLDLVMHSQNPCPLFMAPVTDPKYVLDVGTGPGTWAIDCADKFPDAQVYGIDLYPPPATHVPPNCHLEVEDATKPWTWPHKYDLIHIRLMLGAFNEEEWAQVYKNCYDNLNPGGWIEHSELDVRTLSDDGSLPAGSLIAGWGDNFLGCAERAGRPLNTQETMRARIEKAGFVDVRDVLEKTPVGGWPKDKILKNAGKINLSHWTSGLEGWAMWLLTRYGAPKPWTADEVREYVAGVKAELKNKNLHIYHNTRIVSARKPDS